MTNILSQRRARRFSCGAARYVDAHIGEMVGCVGLGRPVKYYRLELCYAVGGRAGYLGLNVLGYGGHEA